MDLLLKAAAVGGIFMIWYNFTKEAFNFSWHIMTTSPEKETLVVRKAVCEKCGHVYHDDDFDEIIGKCLCFDCRV